jgi:hypothetical protein
MITTLRSMIDSKHIAAYGTSEGVTKAWDARGRGKGEGGYNKAKALLQSRGFHQKGYYTKEEKLGKMTYSNWHKRKEPGGPVHHIMLDRGKGTKFGYKGEIEEHGHGGFVHQVQDLRGIPKDDPHYEKGSNNTRFHQPPAGTGKFSELKDYLDKKGL